MAWLSRGRLGTSESEPAAPSLGGWKRFLVVASLAIGVAITVPTAILSNASGGQPAKVSTTSVDSAVQAWSQAANEYNLTAPRLALPPDQRAAWISAFNAQAVCMHSHGISDFPTAPSSFGDGNTPSPIVGGPPGSDMDPASAAFQAAAVACPFDSSNLDQAAFQKAFQAWFAAHPGSGSSTPALPGQGPPVG